MSEGSLDRDTEGKESVTGYLDRISSDFLSVGTNAGMVWIQLAL